jgi:hypothetical protein
LTDLGENVIYYKKFWEELIRLLSLHTTLHAMVAIATVPKESM